jgi:hypothetical protein
MKVRAEQVIYSLADDQRHLALAMLLWQQRIANPEMSIEITPADIDSLRACAEYLSVTPAVRIFRPVQMAEKTLRPGFYVQLVDEATGSTFKPIESDEKELDRSQAAAKWRSAKESIPELVRTVKSAMARGETSDYVINELCDAAMLVAQSPVPR